VKSLNLQERTTVQCTTKDSVTSETRNDCNPINLKKAESIHYYYFISKRFVREYRFHFKKSL
jgi:hypothetical protein